MNGIITDLCRDVTPINWAHGAVQRLNEMIVGIPLVGIRIIMEIINEYRTPNAERRISKLVNSRFMIC